MANNDITRAPLNNFLTNVADTTSVNSVTTRVDHMFNYNNRIYARFNYILTKIVSGNIYPTLFSDFRANEQRTMSAAYAGNWTRNLQPNLINDLRGNFTNRSNFVEAASGNSSPGSTFPASSHFGYKALDGKVHVHDLHATILHLLGLDHQKLTYRYNGRDFRLTDVYGEVVKPVLS